LNETLCRALIQARLTEEDVAAHMQVDPKTVRRWLEGRVPYLRHRWAIASMLGADEIDLWPELRTTRSRPEGVVAIYPHRDAVPHDVWLRLFGSAQYEIGILDDTDSPLAVDQLMAAALADRAASGVKMRICLHDASAAVAFRDLGGPRGASASAARAGEALAIYAPLHEKDEVEIRLHQGVVYSAIYYADDQLLVSQHAHGIPLGHAPVLHLRRAESDDMSASYLGAFELAWAAARSVE
jgi:hypothetical protein